MKAQAGIEFIILMGVVALISLIIVGTILFYLKGLRGDEFYYDLKGVGDSIRNEVYLAASVEDGYNRVFFLDNRTNYNISKQDKSIVVSSSDSSHITFVEVEYVGSFQRGWNNISKLDGVIYVN